MRQRAGARLSCGAVRQQWRSCAACLQVLLVLGALMTMPQAGRAESASQTAAAAADAAALQQFASAQPGNPAFAAWVGQAPCSMPGALLCWCAERGAAADTCTVLQFWPHPAHTNTHRCRMAGHHVLPGGHGDASL
jgi:hypothetical protein